MDSGMHIPIVASGQKLVADPRPSPSSPQHNAPLHRKQLFW